MLVKKPWWPEARTAERVSRATSERHTFNSGAEIVAFYCEVETYIRLGDGAVVVGAFNQNDNIRIPAGVWTTISLVGWAERGADKTDTCVAFRSMLVGRLQIMEWDNPGVDAGATGGSY